MCLFKKLLFLYLFLMLAALLFSTQVLARGVTEGIERIILRIPNYAILNIPTHRNSGTLLYGNSGDNLDYRNGFYIPEPRPDPNSLYPFEDNGIEVQIQPLMASAPQRSENFLENPNKLNPIYGGVIIRVQSRQQTRSDLFSAPRNDQIFIGTKRRHIPAIGGSPENGCDGTVDYLHFDTRVINSETSTIRDIEIEPGHFSDHNARDTDLTKHPSYPLTICRTEAVSFLPKYFRLDITKEGEFECSAEIGNGRNDCGNQQRFNFLLTGTPSFDNVPVRIIEQDNVTISFEERAYSPNEETLFRYNLVSDKEFTMPLLVEVIYATPSLQSGQTPATRNTNNILCDGMDDFGSTYTFSRNNALIIKFDPTSATPQTSSLPGDFSFDSPFESRGNEGLEICFDYEDEQNNEIFDLRIGRVRILTEVLEISGLVGMEEATTPGDRIDDDGFTNNGALLERYQLIRGNDVTVTILDTIRTPPMFDNIFEGSPEIGFAVTSLEILEGRSLSIGLAAGNFNGTASVDIRSEDITDSCSPTTYGTTLTPKCARVGADYNSFRRTVSISPNSIELIEITTFDDDLQEGTEYFRLVIRREEDIGSTDLPVDARLSETHRVLIIRIGDTDATVSFVAPQTPSGTYEVDETAGSVTIPFQLTNEVGYEDAISIPLGTFGPVERRETIVPEGTARGGRNCSGAESTDPVVDYIIAPITLFIIKGQLVSPSGGGFRICNDNEREGNETFMVQILQDDRNYNIPPDINTALLLNISFTVTILASDTADVSFFVENPRVREGQDLAVTLIVDITDNVEQATNFFFNIAYQEGGGRSTDRNDFDDFVGDVSNQEIDNRNGDWVDYESCVTVCQYQFLRDPTLNNPTSSLFPLQSQFEPVRYTVYIPIADDTEIEGDETFTITASLERAINGVGVINTSITIVIEDQDIAIVRFQNPSYVVNEGETIRIQVLLEARRETVSEHTINADLLRDDTFSITIQTEADASGTNQATPDTIIDPEVVPDYVAIQGIERVFRPNILRYNIILEILEDDARGNLIEDNETFRISLAISENTSEVNFFTLNADGDFLNVDNSFSTITIVDNDSLTVGFISPETSLFENEGIDAGNNELRSAIAVTLIGNGTLTREVNVVVNPINNEDNNPLDTAILYDPLTPREDQQYDYRVILTREEVAANPVATSTTITFTAGTSGGSEAAIQNVEFAIFNDLLIEAESSEAFRLELSLGNNVRGISLSETLDNPTIHTVTIRDDDRAQIRVEEFSELFPEGDTVEVRVILEALDLNGLPDSTQNVELVSLVSLTVNLFTEQTVDDEDLLTTENEDFGPLEEQNINFAIGTQTSRGQAIQTVSFVLNDDRIIEGNESFRVTLALMKDVNGDPIDLPNGITLLGAMDGEVTNEGEIEDNDNNRVTLRLEVLGSNLATREDTDIPTIDVQEDTGDLQVNVGFYNEAEERLFTKSEISALFADQVSLTVIVRFAEHVTPDPNTQDLPTAIEKTETEGGDFEITSAAQLILDAETVPADDDPVFATVDVTIVDDNIAEGEERLDIWIDLIFLPEGIDFEDQRHILIIQDDPADETAQLFLFTINPNETETIDDEFCGPKVSNEVEEIATSVSLVLCLDRPLARGVTLQVSLSDRTTTASRRDEEDNIIKGDYDIPQQNFVTFVACNDESICETRATIPIFINDDQELEIDESFEVSVEVFDVDEGVVIEVGTENYPRNFQISNSTLIVTIIEDETLIWNIVGDETVREGETATYTISHSVGRAIDAEISIELSLDFFGEITELAEIEDFGNAQGEPITDPYYFYNQIKSEIDKVNLEYFPLGNQSVIRIQREGDTLVRVFFLLTTDEESLFPENLTFSLNILDENYFEPEEVFTITLSSPRILFLNPGSQNTAASRAQLTASPGGTVGQAQVQTIIVEDTTSSLQTLSKLVTPILLRNSAPFLSDTVRDQVIRVLSKRRADPLRVTRQDFAINIGSFNTTPSKYFNGNEDSEDNPRLGQSPLLADWNAWIVGRVTTISTGENVSIKSNMYNMLTGVDYRIDENAVLGVVIGYEFSNTDVELLGSTMNLKGSGFGGGFYGGVSFFDGVLTTDASVMWLNLDYNAKGRLSNEAGDFGAQRAMGSLSVSGVIEPGIFRIRPSVSIILAREWQEDYTDSLGKFIPKNHFSFARISFGPQVGAYFAIDSQEQIWMEPFIEIRGDYELGVEPERVLNEQNGQNINSYAFDPDEVVGGHVRLGWHMSLYSLRLRLEGMYDDIARWDHSAISGSVGLGYDWSSGVTAEVVTRYQGEESSDYQVSSSLRYNGDSRLSLEVATHYQWGEWSSFKVSNSLGYSWDSGVSLNLTSYYQEDHDKGVKINMSWPF